MKKKEARNLSYREIFVYSWSDVQKLDLLLERMFGSDVYEIGRHRTRKEWRVLIWLTDEEMEVVNELMFGDIPDWDEEYDLLLEEAY